MYGIIYKKKIRVKNKMNKCRLCLNHRKKVISMFSLENEYTFIDMIASITNIEINPEDEFTKDICLECCKKLKEAFKFKMDVERCDAILHSQDKFKKIYFTNLDEVKFKIGFIFMPSTVPKQEVDNNIIKDGETSTTYCNTFIKKIKEREQNTLTITELFKNFKPEPLDDLYEHNNFEMDNNDNGTDSEYDESLAAVKKKYKLKGEKKKGTSNKKTHNIVPIKPKFIGDLKLVPTKYTRNRKVLGEKKRECKAKSICPYCGKLCTDLNIHILQHNGEKKFSCDKCPKAYFTKAGLRNHSHVHEATRSFKCELCVASFYSAGNLNSHMKSHSTEKKFACHICDKAFKRKCARDRHMIRHNLAGKNIKCDLCNMSFHEVFGLRHHMRVHTGERPYKCEICSQPYSYKHDFNRHCFKKHGVFLKRRSVYVMNEEVLKRERALMKDLTLRAHGIIKEGEPLIPFEGPQAALAFQMAIKAIEARQIPSDFQS